MKPVQFQSIYEDLRSRYHARDLVGSRIRRVAVGIFDDRAFSELSLDHNDQPVIANLVASGARLIAQRIGGIPRITATTGSLSDAAAKRAEKHESALKLVLDKQDWDARQSQASYWQVLHDATVLTLIPSAKAGFPMIRVRDPLTHYPDTHLPDALEQRHLFATAMPYQIAKKLTGFSDPGRDKPRTVNVLELFDEYGNLWIYTPEIKGSEVRFIEAPYKGAKLVHHAAGFVSGDSPQGQFDHTIGALFMQARLQHLVVNHAASQVYAETNLEGENPKILSNAGKYAQGPGSVNVISGGTVTKSTNNMSVQVFSEIDRLERAIRLGSGYPTQLSGESSGSYVTGRGTEALLTQVDDNIAYHHRILARALRSSLLEVPNMADGMQLDLGFQKDVEVEVRFTASNDPATTIRLLQLQGAGLIAKEDVMNSLQDVEDVVATKARIEVEMLRDGFLGKAVSDLSQGGLSAAQVAQLILLRRKGKPVEEAMQILEAEAAEAAQGMEAQMPTGDELAGELFGVGAPTQSARLAAPVGGGSQAFSQTTFGG